MPGKTFILNFGHRLSKTVLDVFDPCIEVTAFIKIDMQGDPVDQLKLVVSGAVVRLKEAGGALDGSVPLIVVLPGFTEGAAIIIAELFGRLGVMPRVLALRRLSDGTFGLLGGYSDMGVLDLERVRLDARGRRQ